MNEKDIKFGSWNLPEDVRGHRFPTATSVDGYVDSHGFMHILSSLFCDACSHNMHLAKLSKDGKNLDFSVVPVCPAADWKDFTYTLDIDVPSGKLYFTDDLRPHIDTDSVMKDMPGYINYNSVVDRIAYAKALNAEYGMIYAAVGNTCPSIETLSDGTTLIVRRTVSEDDFSFDEEYEFGLPSICTDLWAVSAIDLINYRRLTGQKPDLTNKGVVIDVPPGSHYKVTVNAENRVPYTYERTTWMEVPDLMLTFELV